MFFKLHHQILFSGKIGFSKHEITYLSKKENSNSSLKMYFNFFEIYAHERWIKVIVTVKSRQWFFKTCLELIKFKFFEKINK